MPTFAGSKFSSKGFHQNSNSNIVTVDVGGQLFQTTKQTLSLAGSKSLFSKISSSDHVIIPFIDRDPELFSILLSLLRTGNLPSKAKAFDIQDLIFESQFYVAAAGATDFSGLQIIDLDKGHVKQTLSWENITRSGSTVQAIGASPEFLFTSFESSRRNSNCIMIYDLNDGLRPVNKIGHYEIFGADLDSAIPATKLQWVSSHNLLMASGSHSGPSGVLGNIKFWDIRTGDVVLELKEKVDCFSDVTVSDTLSAMFKVGVNTGEVFVADLRSMNADIPWVCLGEGRKVTNGKKEGLGCKVETHGNQVFCSKGGNIELWSEVLTGSMEKRDGGLQGRVFRKNVMGRAKDMGGSRITNLSFGGSKMFVTRKDQQCVEVWNSARPF
ncbi:UNVERIFIED_CONTAM: BTB/POZ domain-containing protein [Sesamum radiatum]|uniref:BTB/POZ domain-containing protein n=1 Tax=Sesamum radiatum TaxID=300843 RepID=A0AAW2MEK5_SESRA